MGLIIWFRYRICEKWCGVNFVGNCVFVCIGMGNLVYTICQEQNQGTQSLNYLSQKRLKIK